MVWNNLGRRFYLELNLGGSRAHLSGVEFESLFKLVQITLERFLS